MASNERHPFDCPRCAYSTTYRTKLGGFIGVTIHFGVWHGWYSFRVGFPLIDEEPPQFDENGGESCGE